MREQADSPVADAISRSVKPSSFGAISRLNHAPYERDARNWLALPWIDQYSGKQYRTSTTLATGTKQIARVKSYGEVLEEYEFHEEAKCADASGARAASKLLGCSSDGT